VRPWLGDRAALALLPEGRRATSLILLQAADAPGARAFLDSVAGAKPRRVRGLEVWRVGDVSAALVGDFVAVGSPRNVRAAAALQARGPAPRGSLAADATYKRAVRLLDADDPLARAYVPGEGAEGLLAAQGGLLGRLAGLLDQPGLEGAAASALAERGGLRFGYAGVFRRGTGPPGGVATFAGSLPDVLPRDTIAYFGTLGMERVLELAGRVTGGDAAALEPLFGPAGGTLGRSGERALARAVRPLDDRESAVVVTPPAADPLVAVVVGNTSQDEGGDLLIALQPVLDRLFEASNSAGAVPVFQQDRIGDTDALTIQLSPTRELTYVAYGGRLIIASAGAREVRRLIAPGPSLRSNPEFAPGMRDLLKEASSVVFLDLPRLSALAGRAGLSDAPELRALGPDLREIGSVSGVMQDQPSSQTAEFFAEVP
jgi:hypothetical protein